MPKRILSISIACLTTVVMLAIYWLVLMPWLHLLPIRSEPWLKLILAFIVLGIAIYLFARWRSWPALLFLLGSIPMFLVNVDFVGWLWRMDHGGDEPGTLPVLALLFPSDNEQSPVNAILHYLIYFSMVCLPIAFFWFFFRLIDRHLTKRSSQPLAVPMSSFL
jgi:hypothetical protein